MRRQQNQFRPEGPVKFGLVFLQGSRVGTSFSIRIRTRFILSSGSCLMLVKTIGSVLRDWIYLRFAHVTNQDDLLNLLIARFVRDGSCWLLMVRA